MALVLIRNRYRPIDAAQQIYRYFSPASGYLDAGWVRGGGAGLVQDAIDSLWEFRLQEHLFQVVYEMGASKARYPTQLFLASFFHEYVIG